jgi:ATP-dependent Zn protease
MSFVSLLKCACNGVRPRNDLALLAVLLDRALVTPDALAPGAIVILELPTDLWSSVAPLLAKVLPDRSIADYGGRRDDRLGKDLWIASARDELADHTLLTASIEGATCLFLCDPNSVRSVPPQVQAAASVFTAPPCIPAVVERLLSALFEVDVEVDLPPPVPDPDTLLIATRPSIKTPEEALRVLRRLTGAGDPPTDDAAKRAVADIQAQMEAANRKKVLEEKGAELAAKRKSEADAREKAEAAAKAAKPPVRLRDLSGYGEAKEWGMRLATDLKAYTDGKLEWRDVDKGLLLSSPPGGGKTFYARALANECNVELVSTGYDDWHEASSGDTVTKTLKKKYAEWRAKAATTPIIVFIDEIDSIGSRGQMDHNNSWFGAIINSLLAFLDGAEPRTGVVVIGATNWPDKIDPALLRPGRLETHIAIPAPTIDDIAGFLKHHLGPMRDRMRAAKACRGRSPAEIAKICQEARRLARDAKRKKATAADVIAAVRAGRRTDPDLDRLAAVHESGHALVGITVGIGVDHLDVDAGYSAIEAPHTMTLAQIEAHIALAMGGRAAEAELIGVESTGAMSDHSQAASMALLALGAGLVGPMVGAIGAERALLDSGIRQRIDKMVEGGLARARAIVHERADDLRRLTECAERDRYLTGDEIAVILASPAPGKSLAMDTSSDLEGSSATSEEVARVEDR